MTDPAADATDLDLAVNLARQSLYRFAALSLLDPRAGAWPALDALRGDAVLTEAAALIRCLPEARPANQGLAERPLEDLVPDRVLARLPDSPPRLNETYENTFGLLVANACPPYETEYIDSKLSFQRSNALADISGFYRAFGLTTSDQHPQRHDHATLELEFMALLLGLERQAAHGEANAADPPNTTAGRLSSGECEERMQICRDAQKRFLQEHLSWWLPALGRLLARENRGGFCEAAGIFLAALIPAERALFGVEATTRPAAPSSLDRPESCEGCQQTV